MNAELIEQVLGVIDELYRKYGTELDAEDTAIVQAARNAALNAQRSE